MSRNPGVTRRPVASISSAAVTRSPISTMCPSVIPMSARTAGAPVPLMTEPPRTARSAMGGGRRRGPGLERGHLEPVEPGGVGVHDAVGVITGDAVQDTGQHLTGAGESRLGMGIVAFPHQCLHPDEVGEPEADAVFLEAGKAVG